MTKVITEDTLLPSVLKTLASMGNIATAKVDGTTTALFKDEIPFCLVTETGIYLRSDEEREHIVFQDKKYVKTQISPVKKDDFLKAATQAYWVASGKW